MVASLRIQVSAEAMYLTRKLGKRVNTMSHGGNI